MCDEVLWHSGYVEMAGRNVMMIVLMIVLMVVIAKTTEMPALSFASPVVARALQTTVDSQRREHQKHY